MMPLHVLHHLQRAQTVPNSWPASTLLDVVCILSVRKHIYIRTLHNAHTTSLFTLHFTWMHKHIMFMSWLNQRHRERAHKDFFFRWCVTSARLKQTTHTHRPTSSVMSGTQSAPKLMARVYNLCFCSALEILLFRAIRVQRRWWCWLVLVMCWRTVDASCIYNNTKCTKHSTQIFNINT